jgi:hypothetical protein
MFRSTDKVVAAMEQQLSQRQKTLSREQIPLFSLALSSIYSPKRSNLHLSEFCRGVSQMNILWRISSVTLFLGLSDLANGQNPADIKTPPSGDLIARWFHGGNPRELAWAPGSCFSSFSVPQSRQPNHLRLSRPREGLNLQS